MLGAEVAVAGILQLLPPVAAELAIWWGGNKLLEHAQGNKHLNTTGETIKRINDRLRETPEWWLQQGMAPPKTNRQSVQDSVLDYTRNLEPKKPKPELSENELDRIVAEGKKRGEAGKSAQKLYLRAVEERKSAEHDIVRARIEDSMKSIEATQSEATVAQEWLNVERLSMQERGWH